MAMSMVKPSALHKRLEGDIAMQQEILDLECILVVVGISRTFVAVVGVAFRYIYIVTLAGQYRRELALSAGLIMISHP